MAGSHPTQGTLEPMCTVRGAAAAVGLVLATSCGSPPALVQAGSTSTGVERLRVEVVSTRPHDTAAFTQGLEVVGGQLYEGTGLTGRSSIQRSDLADGSVRARQELDPALFGEGITVAGDRLWQLTWKNGVAIARDPHTLAELSRVSYSGEGWGLCAQPGRLVMSDGSATLTFRDRSTFAARGTIAVTLDGNPLTRLNELECTPDGQVWANVWQSTSIVRIDPQSGQVTALVDASGLLDAEQTAKADVLNGIAALPGTDRFLVTGKLWPTTFEVRFVPA